MIYLVREGEEREESGVAPAALAAPLGYLGPNEAWEGLWRVGLAFEAVAA